MNIKHCGFGIICTLLSACTTLDSVKPFDQQQAATLLHQGRTTQPTQQRIKLSLPNKQQWQRVDMSLGTVGTPIMLIPKQETPDNWNESIRTKIAAYVNDKETTAYKFAREDISLAKAACQQANGDILSVTDQHVIYRIDMSRCSNERDQIQIGNAFNGKDAVYAVYYSAIPSQVSATRIKQLTHVIETAQLEHDPRFGFRY
jgi:hypothetical protein